MLDTNGLPNDLQKSVAGIVTTVLQTQNIAADNSRIPTVVVIGIANVGKSSLITALFGKLDNEQVWANLLKLVKCTCDQMPEEAIRQALADADLVIHMYSMYLPLHPANRSVVQAIQEREIPYITVLNKCDRPETLEYEEWNERINETLRMLEYSALCISATTGEGLRELVVKLFLSLPKKSQSPLIMGLISQIKANQPKIYPQQKSKYERRKAGQQIIKEALLKVSVLENTEKAGNDLLAIYREMVNQISALYRGKFSEDDLPTPSSTFVYEELIRSLAKQAPVIGAVLGSSIGQINALICIYALGKKAVSFYEKYNKEKELQMTEQKDSFKETARKLERIVNALPVPPLEKESLTRDAILTIGTFLTARAPTITFTGVTFSGKSTLINKLFGEKKIEEGLTSDTTEIIVKIKFRSGLLIYDTPGASGLNVELENITRAYLGLQQRTTDIDDKDISPISVEKIPTIDAHGGMPKTEDRKNFSQADLYIFVVNLQSGALTEADVRFYRAVATLDKPIIIVLNKIEDAEQRQIDEGLNKIKKVLKNPMVVAVSATSGKNIDQLVNAIPAFLPEECSAALGKTINKQHSRLIREQSASLYSLAVAVRTAQLLGKDTSRDAIRQSILQILCLYGLIVSKFNLLVTDSKLEQAGISLADILESFKAKEMQREAPLLGARTGIFAVGGTVAGGIIASVLTMGAAVPVILGTVAGGVAIGAPSGALVDTFTRMYQRIKASDVEEELQRLEQFISINNGYEAAASIFAFGRSLYQCCAKIEEKETDIDFSRIFHHEYSRALEALKPFMNDLTKNRKKGKNDNEQEKLIREIAAHILAF